MLQTQVISLDVFAVDYSSENPINGVKMVFCVKARLKNPSVTHREGRRLEFNKRRIFIAALKGWGVS